MNIKMTTIILIVFLLPLISFGFDTNAEEVEIKVTHWDYTILGDPFYNSGFTEEITDSLDDYYWVVNNNEYKFTTTLIISGEILGDDRWYLNANEYDVHIIDGESPDTVYATFNPILKWKFKQYINSGGGFIGRCGGSLFPLPLLKSPDTITEALWIEANSFIRDMDTFSQMNTGYPFVSEYFLPKKFLGIWLPKQRSESIPEAIGMGAYTRIQWGESDDTEDPDYNSQIKMTGLPVNLTNLNTNHPILKGYHGETLSVRQEGGPKFIINNPEVHALASFDTICEKNPDHDINAWSYSPVSGTLKTIMKLFQIVYNYNNGGYIAVDDLPPEWKHLFEGQEYVSIEELFSKVIEDWGPWNKTDEICEANISNAPTVIAFEYKDNGRVVLFGPHLFGKVWYVGEIVNSEDESIYLQESPYHWAYDNGTWITDGSVNIIRDDESKFWYQRREAAWASKKVPDDHLPPVYGRSQVVDISPKLKGSETFTINCCVGRPPDEKDYWDWDEVDLTLKYRFNESGTMGSWMTFDTIHDRPYSFSFTSPNGSGHYEFHTVLEANGTVDDAPSKADTEAFVNTSTIYSDFKLDIGTPLAMVSIPFNSSTSYSTTENITSYEWDFGDGENSSEEHPSHTFDDDGIYYINLTQGFCTF